MIFYFAGHGDAQDAGDGLKGFLVPQNARPEDESMLLPMGEVQNALAGLDCQHVLIILDCCSAGALPKPQRTRSAVLPPPLYWDYLERYVVRKARQVITSAAHNQQALDAAGRVRVGVHEEGDVSGHSPFAQALFEALDPQSNSQVLTRQAGRNGVVTASELYLYISEALYRRVGNSQTPGLWSLNEHGHDQGEYVFLLPGVSLKLEPAPDLLNPAHNPWPGLHAYTAEQTELFTGRDDEIRTLAEKVRTQPLMSVVGPSSVGKTSLVQAGLLPWLRQQTTDSALTTDRGWHLLPLLTLGKAPMITLECFLSEHLLEVASLFKPEAMAADNHALARLAAAWGHQHPDQVLLLALDTDAVHFGRLSSEERQHFWSVLAEGAQQGSLHIIVIVRSDHSPEETLLPPDCHFHVEQMNRDALRQVVERPAAARMVYFALPEELVDCILDEVTDEPAALPLLSETLHRMYRIYSEGARQGFRNDRTLTRLDYEAVGRVSGVAADLAEQLFEELDANQRTSLQRVLMRLVDVQGGQYVRQQVTCDEFEYPNPQATAYASAVISRLSERRLAVLARRGNGPSTLELGHASLMEQWSHLRGWLTDSAGEWALQRELTGQVARWAPPVGSQLPSDLWDDNPRLPQLEEMLWPTHRGQGGLVGRYHRLRQVLWPDTALPNDPGWLNQTEIDFVQKSVTRRARGLQRLIVLTITVFVVLLGLLIYALVQANEAMYKQTKRRFSVIMLKLRPKHAKREERRASAGELAAHAQGLLDNDVYDPSLVLLLGIEAVHTTLAPDGYVDARVHQSLLNTIDETQQLSWRMRLPVRAHTGKVFSVVFRADGKALLTASEDQTARLWDVATGKELLALSGHFGGVRDAQFSPDGASIATAGVDGTLRLWNAATGEQIRSLQVHTDTVRSLAFSPDGTRIVTASQDGTARVWEVATGRQLFEFMHDGGWMLSAQFSPDGSRIVTTGAENDPPGHGAASVWDADTGERLVALPYVKWVRDAAFSPDGSRLIIGNADGSVRVWDADTGMVLVPWPSHTGKGKEINCIAFSSDGKRAVTIAANGQIYLRNATSGKILDKIVSHDGGSVLAASFSPDSILLATTGDDHTVRLWHTATGEEQGVIGGHTNQVRSVAFSPDSKVVATAGDDATAILWNVESGLELKALQAHTDTIRSVAFSPVEDLLVTAGEDATVRLWDTNAGVEIDSLLGFTNSVMSAAFSPDGRRIVAAGEPSTIRIWDLESGEIQALAGHTDTVRAAVYSPDGLTILTGSDDGSARLWDAQSGEELHQFRRYTDGVLAVAFSPDGRTIATGSRDSSVIVWSVESGDILTALLGHSGSVRSVAFSSDGNTLLTASSDGSVRLWDVNSGRQVRRLLGHEGELHAAAFSPDGLTIATTGADRTARLWNTMATVEPRELKGHTALVRYAAFSPDDRLIVSAGEDREPRLWRVDNDEEIAHFVGHEEAVWSAEFSKEGNMILTASQDGTMRLWAVPIGQKLVTATVVVTVTPDAKPVNYAGFSPDGALIVTASSDNLARLWDTKTMTMVHVLAGHKQPVLAAAFSPDGSLVATSSADGSARLWNVATGAELRQFLGHSNWVWFVAFRPDGAELVTSGGDGTAQRMERQHRRREVRLTRSRWSGADGAV